MDRRSFISRLTVASGGLALACGSLSRRAETIAATGDVTQLRAVGYGELIPTAAKNTGEVMLALPRGFEYNVLGKFRSIMSDGRPTPPRHDGMWTFKVGNELRLVRNHEVANFSLPKAGSAIGTANHYDETCGGGTTTLVIDPRTRTLVRDFVSLSGTLINCAGGPTPWGSWISCEETTVGQTVRTLADGTKRGGFPKPHGYCFEVPASANTNLPPVPLKAMGRFVHEAVAVDRRSGIVYLTEDYNPSGFYRFLPHRSRRLAEGGVLQMLAVEGRPDYDTRTGQKQGIPLPVSWVTIENPDPPEADVDSLAVFKQGKAKGGASFARLEGCCTDEKGNIFFTATSGGDNRGGQIWRYEPDGRNGGRVTLVFESPSREILDMPDNICIMPDSDLLFVCEDSDYVGAGGNSDIFVRVLTPDGKMADFAKNIVPKFERTEFAGTTFSKDGKTLFVNVYATGVTCAIWGDWSKFRA
ncbi:MAG TPA: alkaline phosphatase PhoX [Pyrinomonadaceae bacterium]